ncbi:MAG: HlyD family efflux transporter periplasmic adaptor subunit [Bacteroidales bacterium]|jgi:HlyD family secretion protein|nr:HlyD family efflux transporter periplasmic adaptor subunit [Bacteroidales bacterium]MDD3208451.1 HlyD family efflux transporter periplasmic adaptor subunit [Bacteroidales bacterium]MDD5047141.1 HlyD family efflux transporter periplasmic adaptor subunit [Bacteroidales bacterium]MDY0354119.1 HlyD family efflux transporter periplasmic adaptor subunit [Bacteroidales bacterium]HHV04258.1 HlyD family efflux transporter periplasmic adaptor subunit [Bacteroidales bacterium]
MDRKIPKEVLRKERNVKLIKLGAVILGSIIVIAVVISLLRESINLKNIQLSTVDNGTIEVSVSASGKVVPAFEETIIAPIESRIVEVYKKAGDLVDVGTPLVKLDLQSIETDYRKMLDELQVRQYRLEQQRIKNSSTLSNTEMQLKVNDMQIDKMQVEVRNERYLDSIGAGTTDKVRETELKYNVAKLEQEQSRKKFENDRKVADSELRVQELELEIFRKSLAETKRILDDAQIRSPRKAILTYINNQVGTRVLQGTQVAILSDLSHFRIDGEIADSYGDRISTGNKVVVRIGSDELIGAVSNVTPLSKNGVIQFSVQLDDDNHQRLRSGLKTDVYVMNAIKEDVMRIANGPYYTGQGSYELFVLNGNSLEKRKVQLGESNYEYVEVISGLQSGDKVVVSDMSQYRNKNKLKVN